MINWKSIHNLPPEEDCNICIKIGDYFETYKFHRVTNIRWELERDNGNVAKQQDVPLVTLYINLDEILD